MKAKNELKQDQARYFIMLNGGYVKISQAKAETLLKQKRKTIKLYDRELNFTGFAFHPKKS